MLVERQFDHSKLTRFIEEHPHHLLSALRRLPAVLVIAECELDGVRWVLRRDLDLCQRLNIPLPLRSSSSANSEEEPVLAATCTMVST